MPIVGTPCGTNMFAMATGTAITCSLGRWYWPSHQSIFLWSIM